LPAFRRLHNFQKKKILLYLKDMRRRTPAQAFSETTERSRATIDGMSRAGDNDFYFRIRKFL
jgi:hypothetical protein